METRNEALSRIEHTVLKRTIVEIDKHSTTMEGYEGIRDTLVVLLPDVEAAIKFAEDAHDGQMRKYTNVPYVTHVVAVALITLLVTNDIDMINAALLHDTVEDTDVTIEDIEREFGSTVAMLVADLTDVEDRQAAKDAHDKFKAETKLTGKARTRGAEQIKRATLKRIDREHSAKADPRAKTVKLSDLIHNSFSITEHDKHFARIYLEEKAMLLAELKAEANERLYAIAHEVLKESLASLGDRKPSSAPAAMSTFL